MEGWKVGNGVAFDGGKGENYPLTIGCIFVLCDIMFLV